MTRPTDPTAEPREGGEGNRRRRDRHRRGDRGDRPERGDAPSTRGLRRGARRHARRAGSPRACARGRIAPPPKCRHPRRPLRRRCRRRAGAAAFEPPRVAPILGSGNGHQSAPCRPALREPETACRRGRLAPPPRPIEALPPVSMSLPADSGLELVETRSKATRCPSLNRRPGGPRRVRPPRVVDRRRTVADHRDAQGRPPPRLDRQFRRRQRARRLRAAFAFVRMLRSTAMKRLLIVYHTQLKLGGAALRRAHFPRRAIDRRHGDACR